MPGHIVAVVGGKGGVGKSVYSANMALAYLMELRQRPLLIDLDMNSLGDQNLILGVKSPKNIVDVSRLQGNLDLKVLQPCLGTTPSGMSFLSAPTDQTQAKELDIEGLGKLYKSLMNIFPMTIVDVGSSIDAAAVKTFEYATMILVVTTQDVIVINQTKRVIGKIAEYLFPPEMVQVVLNRFSQSAIVNPQVIQKNLGKNLFAAVPEDPDTCSGSLARSQPFVISSPQAPISRAYHDIIRKIQQTNILAQLANLKKPTGVAAKAMAAQAHGSAAPSSGSSPMQISAKPVDAWTALKLRLHKGLVETMDLKKQQLDTNDPRQKDLLREKTRKALVDLLTREDTNGVLTSRDDSAAIVKQVLDEALGLGPLEDLLADDSVTEIMVNARDQIYIEKAGKPMLSSVVFSSEQQMMNVIERIVTPLGRRVDEKTPYVDARLADGSRVHIIIPPLALRGPTITIRKFPKKRITYKDLVGWGSITEEIADFLRVCVEGHLNVIVSGGTGSGKTTLLNILSNFIPASERIITVEDAAELQLGQEHVVRLETRPANIEGSGEVSIRDLIKCCLRMRPDRIVVGECRGGEALDMLQAMNTGHDGSLTTLHANNPRDAIARLETLVMMSGVSMPLKAIREQISSAVHLIIQQSRLNDGSRKVTYITEVSGIQGDVISLQDIFVFKQEGLDKKRKIIGRFVPTGFIPKFVEEMEAKGMKISRNLFAAGGGK
ncbi:MAG: ATPase, T2SS/T4P/T4SS family [Bacteriovoracia bacterium]